MNPSPEARLELRRVVRNGQIVLGWPDRRNIFWRRWWPIVALALTFALWFLDSWWQQNQSRYAMIEREQSYIASQDRCAGIESLPPVAFVMTGDAASVYDSLLKINGAVDTIRGSMIVDREKKGPR